MEFLEGSPLESVLREMGIRELTSIQRQSLPHLRAGRDLIGQSKTGSGKTLAFAIPILERIDLAQRRPQALVLCPTRELSNQVAREIRRLGRRHAGLRVLTLTGGEAGRPQAVALAHGVHIVVGTPGRTLDHLNRGRFDPVELRYLVLDEADRMLDMGFGDEMDAILQGIPRDRQTVFFSATFPESFRAMSRRHQRDPVEVRVEEAAPASPAIEEDFFGLEAPQKFRALRQVLAATSGSVIVFANLKRSVADLARSLGEAGVAAEGLHGDLEQFERDQVLAKFRNGSVRVLVATDVAARGLDIAGLDLVVNFDFPFEPPDYTHRIGRTGRAGASGRAVSLVSPEDAGRFRKTRGERAALEDFPWTAPVDRPAAPAVTFVTIAIAGGRKDKLRPGDILGALTGEAGGLEGRLIGKIEIQDRVAFVAVASEVAERALASLRTGRIKGRRFEVRKV